MGGRTWRCGRFEVPLDPPAVMGILNLTPDSFSDGGRFYASGNLDLADALAAGREMLGEGAAILDVGGESTRPGSPEVPAEEEQARVLECVRALAGEEAACVSIDTRHASTARAALTVGAQIINDVSGFREREMVEVAADSDCGVVVMHMLGEPGTMQDSPRYDDVVAEVARYLAGQARLLETAGIAPERICLDPGIGFGKTVDHNLELLRRLDEIVALGYPVMAGVSRKRLVGAVCGGEPNERLEGSLAAAVLAVSKGASVVRVHDVAPTVKAVKMASAVARGRA